MADELEPVEQTFIADMSEYIADIEDAVRNARDFADANMEAKLAIDGMRDSSMEAAAAISEDRDRDTEAAEALGHLRDEALSAAEAMGHLRDETVAAGLAADAAKGGGIGGGAAGDAGGGFGGLASLMPVLLGGVAAMLPTLAGLVTGLAAAGAGAGAFGILAYPAISQVTTEMGKMATQTKAQKEAWDKLHPEAAVLVGDITNLKSAFASAGQVISPLVLELGDQLTSIAHDILPTLVPLAQAFGNAMSTALGNVDMALSGSGFKTFMGMLTSLQGPAIRGIGEVLSAAAVGSLRRSAPMSAG